MPNWLFALLVFASPFGIWFLWRRGGISMPFSGQLGTAMSSSVLKKVLGVTLVALSIVLVYIFWPELTALHAKWVGPDVPMWWYAVGLAVLVAIVWLFRMNKEQREKSFHVAEWLIGLAAVGGALVVFASWQKEDAMCPDKANAPTGIDGILLNGEGTIIVPPEGMVLEIESCWEEPWFTVDLRQTGPITFSFNQETKVLKYRTPDEFVKLHTVYPGRIDGHAKIEFNRAEMMRLGISTLEIYVKPVEKKIQLTDQQLEALSK